MTARVSGMAGFDATQATRDAFYAHVRRAAVPGAVRAEHMARAARRGMFRTSNRIDAAKDRRDPVALADARTSMCDYRCALAIAVKAPADPTPTTDTYSETGTSE